MDCPTGNVVHTLKTAKAASKRARRRTEKTLAPPTAVIFVASGMWGRTAGSRSQQRPSETTTN